MTTLKQAREQDKLDQFIKEREAEAKTKGDVEALNRGLHSMAGKSKEVPQTSSRPARGD